jgi:hypothetical protein
MLYYIYVYATDDFTNENIGSNIVQTLSFVINLLPIPAMALWNTYWYYKQRVRTGQQSLYSIKPRNYFRMARGTNQSEDILDWDKGF